MSFEWASAYLALGVVVGWLGGLFGIGGGLLLVPALLFSFQMQHFPAEHSLHLALGTTLASIVFTSLASLLKHHQHGAVEWSFVRRITPGILLGTALGAVSTSHIPADTLALVFALFVYGAAGQILLGITPAPSRRLPGWRGTALFGTLTGWISSMVSIGGGTLIVPFLVWCNVSLRQAIGTSSAIGFPVALGGSVGYVVMAWTTPQLPAPHLGYLYLPAVLWISLGSLFAAPYGARATHRMATGKLRKLFAVLLIVIASKMVWTLS